MKFVIKSLLFVNLILQMTNSLRKCFDHDQNLMLIIILIAFSLIGIIGLTIGNRFILIIFAACMTLILIASITIYAIGRSEVDANQPKVPYFTTANSDEYSPVNKRGNSATSKLKSLVNQLFNRDEKDTIRNRNNKWRKNKNRTNSDLSQRSGQKTINKKFLMNTSLSVVSPAILDDYSDEPQSFAQLQLLTADMPVGRFASSQNIVSTSTKSKNQDIVGQKSTTSDVGTMDKDSNKEPDESNRIQSEQWVIYERHLYEKYLNIVSQSIDLVFLAILASWMALLLDEEADQCFGTISSSHKPKSGHHSKDPPVYNYNGVRYSIRPDTNDSPTRAMVRS